MGKKKKNETNADKRSVFTDALETLGTIIDENQKRDAIHIAVEPVVAGEDLWRGNPVKVLDGVAFRADRKEALGIVDPFLDDLDGKVLAGQRFWFLMYPRQVRSLRHVWSHPDFPDEPEIAKPKGPTPNEQKAASEKWLRKFCETADCPPYDVVIRAATGQEVPNVAPDIYGQDSYTNDGEYLIFRGRDAHSQIPPEFWTHVEIVTGIKVPPEKRAAGFSCSC